MEAILIPIVLFIGMFTTISLGLYYKYKTKTATTEHIPGESVAEWYKAKSEAMTTVGRASVLRIGGLLIGTGIGAPLGLVIGGTTPSLWEFFDSFSHSQHDDGRVAAFVFFVIAMTVLCGGLGMVGAYFLERKLNGKPDRKTK